MSSRRYFHVVRFDGKLLKNQDEPTFYLENVGEKMEFEELLRPFLGKAVSIIVMEES